MTEEVSRMIGEQLCKLCERSGPSPGDRIQQINFLLLQNSNAVNHRRALDQMTPLLICALHNRYASVRSLLKNHNADITLLTTLKESALFLATTYDNIETCKVLLSFEKELEEKMNQTSPIEQKLVNIVPEDGIGNSCLHIASKYGRTHLVNLLLSYGASPLERNVCGDLPVHMACRHRHSKVVEILLYSQPCLSLKNNRMKNPVDIAHELIPNSPDLNMILLDFYERESLVRRQILKKKKTEEREKMLSLPSIQIPSKKSSQKSLMITNNAFNFSRDLSKMKPPPSFATRKDKESYAEVSWNYRLSGKSKDDPSSLDDPATGYLRRFKKAYAMVWPLNLFGDNRRRPDNILHMVNEFVRHAALNLPQNTGFTKSIWGQVRQKFLDSHQRHPFQTVEQACCFLKQLSQSAVKSGEPIVDTYTR
jgi:hypothetical protein